MVVGIPEQPHLCVRKAIPFFQIQVKEPFFFLLFFYLDRFKIDQRVYHSGGSLVVGSVGLFTELCPPSRGLDREPRVDRHGRGSDHGKRRAKIVSKNAAHHCEFHGSRQDVEDHGREQEIDSSKGVSRKTKNAHGSVTKSPSLSA